MIVALLFFLLSTVTCVILLWRLGQSRGPQLEAIAFILITFVFSLPLPLAWLYETEGGDISPFLSNFSPWLPNALFFTSLFVFTFTSFYLASAKYNREFTWQRISRRAALVYRMLWLFFFTASLTLIWILAIESGGILSLILTGYRVTEVFTGKGHLAVGIEWLLSLAILHVCYSVATRNTATLLFSLCISGLLAISFLVMGRRGTFLTEVLALLYIAIQTQYVRSAKALVLPGISIFLLLNLVGLVRGDSYESFDSVVDVMISRGYDLAARGELISGLTYTLSNGYFLVPFETLPQVMKLLNSGQAPWFGWTIPQSLALFIPSILLSSRPLPLANWYMEEFYGGGFGLNQGRQFFFLSEAYLNFSWFGSLVWGVGLAYLFSSLFARSRKSTTFYGLAFRALFFGSLVSFVSSDTTGFFVAFMKGYGLIPCVIWLILRRPHSNA